MTAGFAFVERRWWWLVECRARILPFFCTMYLALPCAALVLLSLYSTACSTIPAHVPAPLFPRLRSPSLRYADVLPFMVLSSLLAVGIIIPLRRARTRIC